MGVEHGKALFEEIERYIEAGLPLAATLQVATASVRTHFGLADNQVVGVPFEGNLLAALNALRQPVKTWLAMDMAPHDAGAGVVLLFFCIGPGASSRKVQKFALSPASDDLRQWASLTLSSQKTLTN